MPQRITTRQTFIDTVYEARKRGIVVERSFVLDDVLYQTYMHHKGAHIGHITYEVFGDERMTYVVDVPWEGEDNGSRYFNMRSD